MPKKIQVPKADLGRKIAFICHIFGWGLSPLEATILQELYKMGAVTGLNVDAEVSRQLRTPVDMKDSTFNVLLSRMDGKGVLRKNGRIITLNPAFSKIDAETIYVVEFLS